MANSLTSTLTTYGTLAVLLGAFFTAWVLIPDEVSIPLRAEFAGTRLLAKWLRQRGKRRSGMRRRPRVRRDSPRPAARHARKAAA